MGQITQCTMYKGLLMLTNPHLNITLQFPSALADLNSVTALST